MTKLPVGRQALQSDQEADISRAVSAFSELRSKNELLETRNVDLDKSLALAEAKCERLEHDLELSKQQRDDALARLVEMTTILQTLDNVIAQTRAKVMKTAGQLKEISGAPERNTKHDTSKPLKDIASAFETPMPRPSDRDGFNLPPAS